MVASLSHFRLAALVALVAAVSAVGCKKSKPTEAAPPAPGAPAVAPGPTGGPNPPTGGPGPAPKDAGPLAGWSEARDPVGGFRVLVPGTPRPLDMTTAPEWRKQLQMTMISAGKVLDPNTPHVQTYSVVPPAGFKLGSTPDELYAAFLLHGQGVMTFQDALVKEPVKLGGRPGLKVVAKANNVGSPPKVPDDPEAEERFAEAYRKNAARRMTYFVTTTATRVIVVLVQSEGDPNPAHLKAITDSFAFL